MPQQVSQDAAVAGQGIVVPAIAGLATRNFLNSGVAKLFPGPSRVRTVALIGAMAASVVAVSLARHLPVPDAVRHLSPVALGSLLSSAEHSGPQAAVTAERDFDEYLDELARAIDRRKQHVAETLNGWADDYVDALDGYLGPITDRVEHKLKALAAAFKARVTAAVNGVEDWVNGSPDEQMQRINASLMQATLRSEAKTKPVRPSPSVAEAGLVRKKSDPPKIVVKHAPADSMPAHRHRHADDHVSAVSAPRM